MEARQSFALRLDFPSRSPSDLACKRPTILTGHLETLDFPLVLVSDVHIRQADDDRARLLIDALGRTGPKTELVVLNGDVFDFCLGASAYFQRKFSGLGQALEALVARGVRVVFVEGNHEFHLQEIGWRGVEIVTEQNFTATLKSGVSIKISHGDLIKDDPWYRAFRALVKSKIARFLASLLPGSWLDAYALAHAKVSRSRDDYRQLDHEAVLSAFDGWLAADPVEHGVIGHFHTPYAEPRRTGRGLMLSVDSWDQPNLLVFDGAAFHRALPRGPGQAFAVEPVRSLFAR